MDKELDDILNNLRNYSEPPSASLTDSVLSSLVMDTLFDQQLLALQAYEIPPAPQLFNSISTTVVHSSRKRIATIPMFAKAAAVFVLLLLATWYILQNKSTNKATQVNSLPTNNNLERPINKDSISKIENELAANKTALRLASPYLFPYEIKPVGQNEIELINNDLLYTLMNCNYYIMKPYQPTKNQLLLKVDQYSSVAVNDKMMRFMNVLYKKNRRQRSTWKARRAKNKLASWKKKDSKYFDASAEHQPMDIINIAEFIQNNR